MKITDNVNKVISGQGVTPDAPKAPTVPKAGNKKTKMILIGMLLAIVLVVGVIGLGGRNTGDAPVDPGIVDPSGDGSGEIEQPAAGDTGETPDTGVIDTDKPDLSTDDVRDNNLVKPDQRLDNDAIGDAQENLDSAMDYLEKLEPEETFDPLESRGLDKTPRNVLTNIRMALDLGYTFDRAGVEWYAGSKDNIYQFLLPMSKEGDANVILTGNYINTTGDINIRKFQGNPNLSDLVSPDGGPQDGS